MGRSFLLLLLSRLWAARGRTDATALLSTVTAALPSGMTAMTGSLVATQAAFAAADGGGSSSISGSGKSKQKSDKIAAAAASERQSDGGLEIMRPPDRKWEGGPIWSLLKTPAIGGG